MRKQKYNHLFYFITYIYIYKFSFIISIYKPSSKYQFFLTSEHFKFFFKTSITSTFLSSHSSRKKLSKYWYIFTLSIPSLKQPHNLVPVFEKNASIHFLFNPFPPLIDTSDANSTTKTTSIKVRERNPSCV